MRRSSPIWPSSALRVSLKRRSIRSNASCSSANSRVGMGRRSTGVKSPDRNPLRRGLEVCERVGQPAREAEGDNQPAGKTERENREAAGPERCGAIERERHRHPHAHQPRPVLYPRFAVHTPDAVDVCPLDRSGNIACRTHVDRQQLSDVSLRLVAPGEDASVAVGNGDNGANRNGKRVERILDRLEVDEKPQRPDDFMRIVADGISDHDVVHTGRRRVQGRDRPLTAAKDLLRPAGYGVLQVARRASLWSSPRCRRSAEQDRCTRRWDARRSPGETSLPTTPDSVTGRWDSIAALRPCCRDMRDRD